jgi:hypothetical protein
MVVPAPTIEFSPMNLVSGAIKYAEPARPPLTPAAFWQISAMTARASKPEANAHP